jgi:putative membrane protein
MVIPPTITPEDHARLWREIRSAEANTSGEIYVVVAHSADDFRLVPFLWAAATALVLPWIVWFATNLGIETILVLQVLSFLAVSAALSPASVRYRIVPRGIAGDAAHRAAVAQLMAHGVHLDGNRTAILIYVCMLPRHIEIVADAAIHAKLDARHWQEMVRLIAAEAQSGRLADGLAAAIRTAGGFLAKEFPATATHPRAEMSRIVET